MPSGVSSSSEPVVWRGLDAPRMEVAHVERPRARGTQIGVAYELRYELEPGWLRAEIVGGSSIDVGLLDGTNFFDLGFSPLFNSLPVWSGLDGPRDFVMTWVHVPSLELSRSEQRYEPLGGGVVRFRSGAFEADIAFDAAGIVVSYPGLAERLA